MSTFSRPGKASQSNAAIDLTPMIDVTFLLVIFFLCVTEMGRMELEQLCLPQARSALEEGPSPTNRPVVSPLKKGWLLHLSPWVPCEERAGRGAFRCPAGTEMVYGV